MVSQRREWLRQTMRSYGVVMANPKLRALELAWGAAITAEWAHFVALGVLWCLVLAVGAARLRELFLRRPSMATWLNRVAGAMFIGLGLRLATARQ